MSKEWHSSLFSGLHMDAYIFEYAPAYMNMYVYMCVQAHTQMQRCNYSYLCAIG